MDRELALSDAARIAGKSAATIRRAFDRGEIAGRVSPYGRVVYEASLMQWIRARAKAGPR